ncbi:hypothetical protein ABTE35_19100, partial [Acinetobacter baumannii]
RPDGSNHCRFASGYAAGPDAGLAQCVSGGLATGGGLPVEPVALDAAQQRPERRACPARTAGPQTWPRMGADRRSCTGGGQHLRRLYL